MEAQRLSPQQRLIWQWTDAGLVEPGHAWVRAELALTSDVDAERLAAALRAEAGGQEILRTRLERVGAVRAPFQVIGDACGLDVTVAALPGDGEPVDDVCDEDPLPGRGRAVVWQAAGQARGIRIALPAYLVDGPGVLKLVERALGRVAGHAQDEPVQYGDVSDWLLELGEGEEGRDAARQLAAATPADAAQCLIPYAHTAIGPFRPAQVVHALPIALGEAMAARAVAWNLSPDALWYALHATQLHRYSDAAGIALAVRLDGRSEADLAGVVGPLSRDLPLGIDIAEDSRLRGLAAALAGGLARIAALQDFWPAAEAPAIFAHHVAWRASDAWPRGIDAATSRIEDVTGPFVTRLEIGAGLRLRYDAARLSARAAQLVLDQFVALAEAAMATPEALLGTLAIGNSPPSLHVEPVASASLPERIIVAAHDAGRVALIDRDVAITYVDLVARAERIAGGLVAAGVRRGDRVGLMLANGAEQIAGYVGIWLAEAICVPLDLHAPADRLERIAAVAEPSMILGDTAREGLPCRVVAAHELDGAPVRHMPCDRAMPAYLVFTSGTTGLPKGCAVSHGALAGYVDGVAERLALSPEAELGTLAGLDVDLGYTALFVALGTGRRFRILPNAAATDAAVLATAIGDRPLACLKVVPQHFAGLVAGLDPARAAALMPTEALVFGGDRLTPEIVAQARALRPSCRIVNHYGPTETTIGVLADAVDARPAGPYPLGTPFGRAAAHALDAALRPVAAGFAGELWIGGPTLANGYWQAPAETADRFRPDPLATCPGARRYRTGDRVRQLDDGSFAFVGRTDHQIKLRGVRIELGEIEAALRTVPGVIEAVADVRLDGVAPTLVGYLRTELGATLDRAALQAALAPQLPATMIPQRFAFVSAFDRTPSGKIDRRRLQRIVLGERRGLAAAPRNPREAVLVEIIAKLINAPDFGIHDNFFEAGGDSIVSIQVAAQARKRGVVFTSNLLFKHQTVAELAAAADDTAPVNARQGLVVGESGLLPIQARFAAHRHPAAHHFNQSLMVATGAVDTAALLAAIGGLLAHHDMLRATLVEHADDPRLGVGASIDPAGSFAAFDLSHLPVEARSAELTAEAARQQASLGLAGPLFKAAWFTLAPDDCRLLLIAHHLVIDAMSWHVLLADLLTLIEAHASGAPARLPAKTTAFADFVTHIEQRARAPELLDELPFWRAQAPQEAAPAPEWGLAGGDNTFGNARKARVAVSADAVGKLLRAAPLLRASVEELMLAALARAVATWTGDPALSIELEGHGRQIADPAIDLSRTVGWFTARYPVRLMPAGDDRFAYLRAAKATLRQVPAGGIGHGMLASYPGPHGAPPPLAGAAIPFVSLNYLGQLAMEENGADESGGNESGADGACRIAFEPRGPERAAAARRDHLLALNAQIIGATLHLDLTYAAGFVSEASAQALVEAVAADLDLLASEPGDVLALTTADYPLAAFADDATLRRWLARQGMDAPADIYPLSSLQHGMAIETLRAPGTGAYLLQLVAEFSGAIDPVRLRAAWDEVAATHPALRSTLHDLDAARPLQVVHADPRAHWHIDDWSGADEATITARAQAWLRDDRLAGFDFARASLMRFALIRTAPDRHLFVWTRHHVIIDGWSSAQVLQQVFARYDHDAAPAATPPFRSYIAWLHGRADEAPAFWAEHLAGVAQATPIALEAPRVELGAGAADNLTLTLDPVRSAAVRDFARARQVSLATLMRSVWGAVLARNAGASDAVLGVTMSGRPDDLPQVEAIVGPFINTVPVRVRLPGPHGDLGDWLRAAQHQQAALDLHAHTPLAAIQSAAGLAGARLFDTLFIFENFPMDRNVRAAGLAGQISAAQTLDKTSYPLTVLVDATDDLTVRFSFNPSQIDAAEVRALSALYDSALDTLLVDDAAGLATLPVPGGSIPERRAARRLVAPRLVVSGSFAPEPLLPAVAYWSRNLGYDHEIVHVGNGQVFQDLLDPAGPIGSGTDVALLLVRWHDIGADAAELADALHAAVRRGVGALIVALCPPPPSRPDRARVAAEATRRLLAAVSDEPTILAFDAAGAFAEWQVADPHDPQGEAIAGIAYTAPAYAAIAMAAARRYDALRRKPYKAIVVDADNTLWGGICGEVGTEQVRLDGAWAAFRAFLRRKRAEGFLLALCSRNNPADVAAVFARAQWDLPLADFAAVRIGWGSKADAVVEIADELGLGVDSLLFLDDDAANVAEVGMRCSASAITVPGDPAALAGFADRLWPLDRFHVLAADVARADSYAIERDRTALAHAVGDDFDAFMSSLEIVTDVRPLAAADVARAADLIQRTNQFNLTLRRDTVAELRARVNEAGDFGGTVVRVRDRFGDYGLVGVMLHRVEGGLLMVEQFLLSCRALARGVEAAMARHLAGLAADAGCHGVQFRLRRGERNQPAELFFDHLPGERHKLGDGEALKQAPLARLRDVAVPRPVRGSGLAIAPVTVAKRRAGDFYATLAGKLRSADQIVAAAAAGQTPGKAGARAPFVPPDGELESVLATAYAEILGVEQVGRYDSFFGLGGNSLQAVQLVGRIRRVVGAELQLRAVFENPTVAALAQEVALFIADPDMPDEDLEVMEF